MARVRLGMLLGRNKAASACMDLSDGLAIGWTTTPAGSAARTSSAVPIVRPAESAPSSGLTTYLSLGGSRSSSPAEPTDGITGKPSR